MIHEKYEKKHCVIKVQGGGGSVGIWGCISINGAGVCRCYFNRMNTELYIETMENSLKPSIDLLYEERASVIYQQDNAPCQKSRLSMAWFADNQVEVMDWPARSPDLNPIEHIWSMIDQRINGMRFDSLAQLEEELVRQWNAVTRTECVYLIESMPERILLCLKAQGDYFKY
jgi:hypothetical protein